MARLPDWAKKHTTEQDLFVLEASGNRFQVVRTLKAVGRKAKVLESCQMGKLKEAHANNDKISAVRIGKAYLAGTAKEVWVPDLTTQERRDILHAYRKAYRQELYERLKAGRVYVLDPNKKHTPQPQAQPEAKTPEAGLADEYGLRRACRLGPRGPAIGILCYTISTATQCPDRPRPRGAAPGAGAPRARDAARF